ncbi:LytR/AlgR family response regulator transcription factor [Pseudoalteromonas 'SMAR']|uniref:LytR/AlgR family response regulator transcription factor n=1 Tax=Pseudoalteromonas 'SMAR' TaxID=3416908 RepID=UPI003AF1FC44
MIKLAIVEDELPALEKLKQQLAGLPQYQLSYCCGDGETLLQAIPQRAVDIVLIDINLPGINGIELVQALHRMQSQVKVIFTTAYSEFAVDAFTLGAVDYLLKPYTDERLALALSRAQRPQAGTTSESLPSKLAGKTAFINVADIEVVKLEYGQAIAYCNNQRYPLQGSLDALQTKLPSPFLRVHRDTLVNQAAITDLQRWPSGGYLLKFKQCQIQVITSRNGARLLKQRLNL